MIQSLDKNITDSRQLQIEISAGDGSIESLKKLLEISYTQLEIDTALENAIAYSQIDIAKYLVSLGADSSSNGYNGVYYAVHNNELDGFRFAIEKGVDINEGNGLFLNESIITAINTKSIKIVKWILYNGANPKLLTNKSLELVYKYGAEDLKILIKSFHRI